MPVRLPALPRGALLALALLIPISAHAAANHVVISELAHRGPVNATQEFVELYNPTESAVNIGGWHLQYKPAAGSSYADRAVFPANTSIPAHGYFLIMNNAYASPPIAADYTSGIWGSGQGMADSGNERLLDASLAEVDRIGWGTAGTPADNAEGTQATSLGTSATNNSLERKALATSTADSLAAGGRHALLGNGQDTNNNANDFATQTHGRDMQNSASTVEPAFTGGGNGTGRARISPTIVFTSRSIDSLRISIGQDSSYTLTKLAILVPSTWTWSHQLADVVLSGTAFTGTTPSISGDSLFIDGAAVTTTDSGAVTLTNLTSPSAKGNSVFTTRTAVSGGTLTALQVQPQVRVLDLVPIVVVHVNDANGVATAPYAVGTEVTVTGVVTANYSGTRTDMYLQDGTAGIDLFSFDPPPFTVNVGDSLTATGSVTQFRGLIELTIDFALLTVNATNRPVPEPEVLTCAQVNATFHADGTEPNESRLIRINSVTYNSSTSTITDASGTTNNFIPNTYPPTPSTFDIIGILKQFKPGTPAPGPPYKADYEITPRTPDDIIADAGPVITSIPYEDDIQPTSVTLHWTTNVASTSIVRYGTTAALGDSVVNGAPVTSHNVPVPGLQPATVYFYSVGSADGNGANFSPNALFSTASPAQTTGQINVYFNKSVNTSLAQGMAANGNQNLPARLKTRIDNAKRSIDAAIYSMSGTVGSTIANALVAAKNRGVKVRVVCEYDNSGGSGFTTLQSNGIPLINDRFDTINNGLGLMHNKFMSIDSRGGAPDSAWVWTGSWNLTDPGTDDDMQNSIEIQDLALAKVYTLEFEEMWGSSTETPNASNSKFGPRKLDNTPHHFAIGHHLQGDVLVPIPVESYFSPSDGVTSRIISQISAAQHSVAFDLLTLTRDDISPVLVARKNAGLKVRGALDNNTDSGSQYSYLVSNGVDVRLKTGVSGLLHHKYALFDAENPTWDAVTLTGSHNWSSAAENNNNENTVIVHDASVTNQYLQEFAARYYQFGGTDSIHTTAVELVDRRIPPGIALSQNAPNPWHGKTHLTYALPARGKVALRLFDVAGREVKTIVNRLQEPGTYRVDLEARGLHSGVYFVRLEAAGQVQQRKMLLMN